MHIAVDATMIKPDQAGLRTYAVGIVRALAETAGNKVSVFTLAGHTANWGGAEVLVTSLRSGEPLKRALWREVHLGSMLKACRADVLVVPAPESLRLCGIPQAIVVHDLGPVLAPHFYGWKRYLQYAATIRDSCNRAHRVFAVSSSTKLDIVRWAGVDPRKIRVVPNATQEMSRGPHEPLTGEGGYTLYVGAALRHKNVATLIRAFYEPSPGMPPRLVIAGPDYGGEVAAVMSHARGHGNIEHRGFVSAAELDRLYREASNFAFPSVFEGYGIPLAEAMSYGLPVVASDISGLREVGGDGVAWVSDPFDVAEWRSAIASANNPVAPAVPASWADSAEQMAASLREMLT